MSFITDIVLVSWDRDAATPLNEWLAEHDSRKQRFEPLDTERAGGTKIMGDDVWAMGGNYVPWLDLFAAIKAGEVKLVPGSLLYASPEQGGRCILFSTWSAGIKEMMFNDD